MIELFLLKPNEMLEIPTESITWSGKRYSAARKLDVKMLSRNSPGIQAVRLSEGDTLLFKWKGKELFRGIVFSRSMTKSGLMSVVVYDMLQYLLLNKDVYVFTNKRADQIATRILKDFNIPYGSIANTSYKMKSQSFTSETTLYDMILKSLIETEKENGRRFYLSSEKGKVYLKEVKHIEQQWVLETGVNIEEYNYSTSIEDVATKVKLVAGEEKKEITAVVTDDSGQSKYGIIQHYEKVSDKLNQGQLDKRAKSTLNEKKGIKKTFDVDALGIPDLISNMPVRVIEKDLGINKTHFIDEDSHTFEGKSHTMKLKLIEKNDRPTV